LKKSTYLDIHTHRSPADEMVAVGCLTMENLRLEHTAHQFSTAGIHPWWLEDISHDEIEKLKQHILNLLSARRLWGIGETGIDRLYPELLEQQKILFQWHFELAEIHQLPLIIHSVRSGSDFLEILKGKKPSTPWIFHDFRGNVELVHALLRLHPHCYFSFGLSLDNSPQVRELIPLIPLEQLFLETDAQKHLDIHDIYLRAAEQLGMDLELLKSQLWHNFKKMTPNLH
jgi:TatD DNase family protein